MTKDLAEINGQITKFQQELRIPLMRIKMLAQSVDQFGDEITDKEKEKHFEKAKEHYEKCKEKCIKSIRDLPKMQLEKPQ